MRTYTATEYEQEDFDAVREEMTVEEAINILEGLPRGWFPYNLPKWGNAKEHDYDNYRICCAIWFAIERLKERESE